MQRSNTQVIQGGRFDFDDGGMYCGGWEDEKAHGYGVCTGLKGQGEYAGSWNYGFEVTGVYTWPGGSTYEGQWQNGKRHGLGIETRGRWIYSGEWTVGLKGRYGVRQSVTSVAKFEGTWSNGLQDGYGTETYADGGKYQGQWFRGLRHGYGVRVSAPYGVASGLRSEELTDFSCASLYDESACPTRGGFVLQIRSEEPLDRRKSFSEKSLRLKKTIRIGLKMKKQRSAGDLKKNTTGLGTLKSSESTASWMSSAESSVTDVTCSSRNRGSNGSFVPEDEQLDASVTETYMGEWKNDKRNGFGITERSDGLKYEGEWYNNKKYGYGVTTFKDGTKEEGKYKNNVLITSQNKKHLFLTRSAKFRQRIDSAVSAAQRASKMALQKADIAISRTSTARAKAEQAETAAEHARLDAEYARAIARKLEPEYKSENLTNAICTVNDSFADLDSDTPTTTTPNSTDDKTYPGNRNSGWTQQQTNPSFDSGFYQSTDDTDLNFSPSANPLQEDEISLCSSYAPNYEEFAQEISYGNEVRRVKNRNEFLHNAIPRRSRQATRQNSLKTLSNAAEASSPNPPLSNRNNFTGDPAFRKRLLQNTQSCATSRSTSTNDLHKLTTQTQGAELQLGRITADDCQVKSNKKFPIPLPDSIKAWMKQQRLTLVLLLLNMVFCVTFLSLLK